MEKINQSAVQGNLLNTGNEIWLKSKEAEELLNTHKMKLVRLRKRNEVIARPVTCGKGRSGYEYLLSSFPEEAQRKYLERMGIGKDQTAMCKSESYVDEKGNLLAKYNESKHLPISKQNRTAALAAIQSTSVMPREKDLKIELARAEILKLYRKYIGTQRGKIITKQFRFCEIYNNGGIPGYEYLKKIVKKVSRGTIEGWRMDLEAANGDTSILRPKYMRTKKSAIPFEQAKFIVNQYLNDNKRLISEIVDDAIEAFTVAGEEIIFSPITYRRFLKSFKKKHADVVHFYREGIGSLNDNVLPYMDRDRNRIEVGDIVVADGHKLNFLIIDPMTGKPVRMILILFYDMKSSMPLGWEICRTENTKGIAVALYRTIKRLGKIPKIIYIDNGRAFKSKFFLGKDEEFKQTMGIIEKLGCKVMTAWPYHGQSKTIENFFGIFSAIERLMPTYTGTSIELQPAWMHRGEKLHQKVHQKLMNSINIDLLAAHRAAAMFFDRYASKPHKGGYLKGKRSIELFEAGKGPGVDDKEIIYLMMKKYDNYNKRPGVFIKRCEFRIFGKKYFSEGLYGLEGWFDAYYDLVHDGTVYIYDQQTGEYITMAKPKDVVHPAASILGTQEDVELLNEKYAMRQRLINSTTVDARMHLEEEILPSVQQQLIDGKIIQLKEQQEEERNKIEKVIKRTGTDDVPMEMLKPAINKKQIEDRDWFDD